jgi:tRNA 5-methylaminomethyl-2-thiouridine biosynthesis bifunctional protein
MAAGGSPVAAGSAPAASASPCWLPAARTYACTSERRSQSLRKYSAGWQALDARGGVLASAPHVILANALAANRLLPRALPLTPIRGQISCLSPRDGGTYRSTASRALPVGLCDPAAGRNRLRRCQLRQRRRRSGHAPGRPCRQPATARRTAARRRTKYRCRRAGGRVGLRCTTPDRLPLVGACPTLRQATAVRRWTPCRACAGLHALLGLSARGMVWAPLAAELLASQLDGEPLPVERRPGPRRRSRRASTCASLRRATAGL